MREWARLYQTPLWLTAAFLALLKVFALTPDPIRSASEDGAGPTSEPTRAPGECIVCGIDQRCDPASGRCVFAKATPLPCVQGAEFDEKAGFCLPTGAPTAVPILPEDEIDPESQFQDRDREERRSDREDRFGGNFPFDD